MQDLSISPTEKNSLKRVLIISYYWPPAGGGGVMRWLKLSKYLAQDSQWQPVVYCPKNANYLIQDPSLLNPDTQEINTIQEPIIEPNDFLLKLGFTQFLKGVAAGGVGKEKKSGSAKSRLMVWIRSNFFIPDARALWIRPSIKRLRREMKKQAFDAIISTGPPHSMHLIAKALKREFSIPWIADFRDPWTFIDFFEDLDLSKKSREKHLRLEQEVLDEVDCIVTVSKSWADSFAKKTKSRIELIRNGFDPADYSDLKDSTNSDSFKLCHIGSLNKDRNAPLFWESIAELCVENSAFAEDIKIEVIGSVSGGLEEDIKILKIDQQVQVYGHMAHRDVLQRLKSATISLLFINNTQNKGGIIPGKLYEYLAIANPIFCVGNLAGDSAQIIQQAKAGVVCEFEDKEKMKSALLEWYETWKKMGKVEMEQSQIEQYSRKAQAAQYADLLDDLKKKEE